MTVGSIDNENVGSAVVRVIRLRHFADGRNSSGSEISHFVRPTNT